MLRYIIGVSLITIGIIVVRALSNGKVLKKHQYAFWIVIPLYMILAPFIKFDLPEIDLMKPAASTEIETTEYEEVTDAPSVITIGNTQAGHSNSNNNQAVIRETEKDSQAVTRPVQAATQNAPVSEVKTKNTFKADTVLKYISCAVSAALIVFLQYITKPML